ncbi:diguanylate cyclase [Krasilnikovia sp. MM14-A1259]|uniref:GGDEF domain-containing protein n=1 Tax=Krasilnikovia sp. MM14-A1259 TaxID=3373539 RepID=UPI0037F60F79
MGSTSMLPAPILSAGPLAPLLAAHVHDLYLQASYDEALDIADEYEWIALAFHDRATARGVLQARLYVLTEMGRNTEAEAFGRALLGRAVSRVARAKASADLADVLVRLGRLEDGLHLLAVAMNILETCPRDWRYYSAMSSVVEPARWVELYELAEQASVADPRLLADPERRAIHAGQRAESLLEWALRLEHVGRTEEADLRYREVITLMRPWADPAAAAEFGGDHSLRVAKLACALAKTGEVAQARELAVAAIAALHAKGRGFDARLAHLAYGVALRSTGDYEGAARELIMGEQVCTDPGARGHRQIFQYELGLLAAESAPGPATQHLMTALRACAEQLWRLRLDRVAMLRQARRRVQLEAAHAHADRAAQTDPLTMLANRRGFDRRMAGLADDATTGPMCLLLVDLDRFKQINDGFSHAVGDAVLREIGHVLRSECRATDLAARFGGDEFGVFLGTDIETAARVAARMRAAIRDREWHRIAVGLQVTVSMGLAALDDGMTGEALFAAADEQLYRAKRAGRDRLAA